MPWDCGCGRTNLDSLSKCGGCGNLKTSWTIQIDQTRALVISTGPKLKVETGVAYAGSFDHPGVPVSAETTYVPVMDKKFVKLFEVTGEVPPSGHLLVVTEPPPNPAKKKKKKKKTTKLTLEYARKEVEELDLFEPDSDAPSADEGRTAVFLFIHGPEPEVAEDVSFPGIRIIDITEDTFLGFAPTLKVGKKSFFVQELLPELELHEVARKAEEAATPTDLA